MRNFMFWGAVAGLVVGSAVSSLRGEDQTQIWMAQQALAANEMHNHRFYPNQSIAQRSMFQPAYYGPVMGYGPYFQGYSIPSPDVQRFGSSPGRTGGVVPMVRPRTGGGY